MPEPQAAVRIDNITKSFPGNENDALKKISANIYPGQMTGLVGPDGAGKTTLIRLICGLLLPTAGKITVLGYDSVSEAEKIHQQIGYMPQKFGLYEDLTVIENLELYADLRSKKGAARQETFKRLLEFTKLENFQKRLAGNLSGGMKQKLGLACALMGEPKLLVLDEPSVGVDPISRRELWQMVKDLLHQNIAVIWSTAYLDEAEQCDHVLLLNEGKNLYHGKPSDLLASIEEQTWLISGIDIKKRRSLLMKLLQQKEVIDGVIQGKNIRISLKEADNKPHLPEIDNKQWQQTSPVFEDAFIYILGGGPGGYSRLAEEIPAKPKTENNVIETIKLTKRFGDFTAVSDISFNIKRGEIFGLLGPNGAGKSTTFKMLCGLLQATEGEAMVMGLDLKKAPSKARAKIGYMAQKFSLYGELNVLQNLSFFSGLYGLSGKIQKERIEEMIDIFDLNKLLKHNPNQLPLGFKQRLSLACALMHYPDILFLDEPTSGVDPVTRREFWTHINGMVTKGVTIMVTTHYMDEAEYCDRIALIYKGQNIATGTPDDLKNKASREDETSPSLEEAFINLIQRHDEENP
jgi:ABC-2 type transport system ATP-binding protein